MRQLTEAQEFELEPGPPDPDDCCPVCDRYERDCICPPEELNAEQQNAVKQGMEDL